MAEVVCAAESSPPAVPAVVALGLDGARAYVLQRPDLLRRLAPEGRRTEDSAAEAAAAAAAEWVVREVGDGNINFVYIVEGLGGGVCLKQALPFLRCVGESWPLTVARLRIEAEALGVARRVCPQRTPEVFSYDEVHSVMAMEYLAPPAIILRKGIIAGEVYPHVAEHLSEYLAQMLFCTSAWALGDAAFEESCQRFRNGEFCALTVQVVFEEPYVKSANNRWTTPQLDTEVSELWADAAAREAALQLGKQFLGSSQALLHGDLHTGSVMVTKADTWVIDAEFAFVGPMAFDLGKLLGELLLSFFASHGHDSNGSRAAQQDWLLQCIVDVWTLFVAKFSGLCASSKSAPAGNELDCFIAQLLADSLCFAGAAMVRRIVGLAHVADMDTIEEPLVRAACERRALRFGRRLLKGSSEGSGTSSATEGREDLSSIEAVVRAARVAASS